ncbi:hypothetical protein TVAG_133350 [Trichomonas vaginalis G3]|uniref:Uncharacterized protein n=1 Tax=Trichomonas vaginalis (strain ATCC PRA-98 / G3) TaxID=412133 RepID=A2EDL2_TRIV3|nr:hypothetical protein TVAGG3_0906090 [Trichomonas vaginalis G3]EAY09277.1 hypothetical protein TVAG_133350 [Trichomonas vaginalis G3]KAI5484064.1 hypothetical protein TVAGG3_0906090 [Trichomonas vaginalis G3]|eukprot:XP_001321500.1 hypothetical protein [Trichomonas vaginalis G3]
MAIAYVYIKAKTQEPSDSDVLEMSEDEIQSAAEINIENPLYMTTQSLSDDIFAQYFQNKEEDNKFYKDQKYIE